MKVSSGKDCRNNKDSLKETDLHEIFEMITLRSESDLTNQTKQLRSVLQFSKERYREMKTRLPFFSCSIFLPSQRSIHNFQRANGMILDYDFGEPFSESVIQSLKDDPRIAMGYISPSNQGLKLVFKFSHYVKDAHTYTMVYKSFSRAFSLDYKLINYIDFKNCDVSRISFICHDPQAWYNENPVCIDPGEWYEEEPQTEMAQTSHQYDAQDSLDPESYRAILKILDTKPKSTKPQLALAPAIELKLPELEEAFRMYQIIISEKEPIQYGVKIRLKKDKAKGEINIYYGKRGFQVVSSPRRGTMEELNNAAKIIAEGIL